MPDAQGQAALLLVESLIHSLLDKGALTQPQALEAVAGTMSVKQERADEGEEPEAVLRKSPPLLVNVQLSIKARSGSVGP